MIRIIFFCMFIFLVQGCEKPLSFEQAHELVKAGEPLKAIPTLVDLADAGDFRAQTVLGLVYLNEPVRDDRKAALYLKMAVDNGVTDAMNLLGHLYEDGQGVPRNPSMAAELWKKGAAASHVPSMLSLAHHYDQLASKSNNRSEASNYVLLARQTWLNAFEHGAVDVPLWMSSSYVGPPDRNPALYAVWKEVGAQVEYLRELRNGNIDKAGSGHATDDAAVRLQATRLMASFATKEAISPLNRDNHLVYRRRTEP